MAIKIYLGKQDKEGTKVADAELIDAGATDYNVEENIQKLESQRFQDVQAQGDSTIGKVDVGGNIPIEFSEDILKELLSAISYTKGAKGHKMSNEKPAFYTIVLADSDNNEKWTYTDCMVSDLKLNIALGGYITGGIDIIGKTYEIGSGGVTGAKAAGDVLRALHAKVELDSKDISADIEGLDIDVQNGIEAKGSLNSLYNTKFRRATPQATLVSIQKNEYDAAQFKALKTKMIDGTPVKGKVTLGKAGENDTVSIEIPKMFINSNKRGDYKGAGTHSIELNCSANNEDQTHMIIKFKGDEA